MSSASALSKDSRIYVAGHRGLVGSAVLRALQRRGYANLLCRSRQELDLIEQAAVRHFFQEARPDAVILAAARVGGIHANDSHPAQFIRDNLVIQDNVIDAAFRSGVAKFVFLGSSCIYPKLAPQPIKEEYLLTGPLEPTNEWYAIAKIAGVKMCQAYRREYGFKAISLMPTNLYGPGDNFDLLNSHVLPEFLHVDDLADAVLYLLHAYDAEEIVNIGWGQDVTIRELAELVMTAVGYHGRLLFDDTKPDGTPRKLLDTTRLTGLGWKPQIPLKAGIERTYAWFTEHSTDARL
jgi:GDP-L-fucose synthase